MMKLLTISDVARTLGVTYQCARQWAGLDKRGSGGYRPEDGFPEPISYIGKRESPVYEAEAVTRWASARTA